MIIVETKIVAPIERIWALWTTPDDIKNWYFASDDWHVTYAENDLSTGGKFKTVMAARDGSAGFDFEGIYTKIERNKKIEYKLGDGRRVKIVFSTSGKNVVITESFDPETINTHELQRNGWQAILNNFKKYADQHK